MDYFLSPLSSYHCLEAVVLELTTFRQRITKRVDALLVCVVSCHDGWHHCIYEEVADFLDGASRSYAYKA